MASEHALTTGLRVGNYVLAEGIGRGAFGEVWKAVHFENPDRVRAIKFATNPAFRRQLAHEGGRPEIDHPNVVPILDSDTHQTDLPYVVMPYLAGGNLADLLRAHPGGLPEERVAAVLRDILAGLAAAHARGIVHRDIKPQNILLDEDGRALVSDFGLSCGEAVPDAMRSVMQSTSLALDQGGTLAGTLAYMAPEVLDGAAPTPAADVYSVGVLLFEILVGRRPSGIETPRRARANLCHPLAWDRLYVRACCPLRLRFADAPAVQSALQHEETTWKIEAAAPGGEARPASNADPSQSSGPAVASGPLPPGLSVLDLLRAAVRVGLADWRISSIESHELEQIAAQFGATAEDMARVVAEVEAGRPGCDAAPLATDDICDVLRAYLPDKRIHIAPGIPERAVAGVQSHCSIPPAERIVALVNCTTIGCGKDALAFTDRGLYYYNTPYKNPLGTGGPNCGFVEYPELSDHPPPWMGGAAESSLFLDAERVFNPNAFPKNKLCALLVALRERLRQR